MKTKVIFAIVFFALALALAACSAPASRAPIQLGEGRFTPLGGVTASNNPTASDLVDLQTAESGTLGTPALVEFYADN